jgi:phage terminase large subunit
VVCIREFQNSIEDSVHRLLSQWINSVPELQEFYRIQQRAILGANGTEFIFRGMKKETAGSVKSLEGADICWAEEAQYLSRESLDILLPTIRKAGAEHIWTLNPTNRLDPVYVDFVLKERPDTAKALVNLTDNPFASEDLKLMADLAKEDEATYRHVWLGECRSESSQQLISVDLVDSAIGRESTQSGALIFGVDVARFGDDSSVCVARRGGAVEWVRKWHHITPMDLAEQVAALAEQYDPSAIVVDEVGLGVGTLDPMKRALGGQCKVVGFNGARRADNDLYANKRAESWGLLKEWLKEGSLCQGEAWADNISQVRFFYTTGKNAVQLEDKGELKGRSGFSPDLGDALAMTFCAGVIVPKRIDPVEGSYWA